MAARSRNWLGVVCLCGALAALGAGPANEPPAAPENPPARKPKFVPGRVEGAVFRRGDLYVEGEIDVDGNFFPDFRKKPYTPAQLGRAFNEPYPGFPREAPLANKNGTIYGTKIVDSWSPDVVMSEDVYEYRSGALIHGRLTTKGKFIPFPGIKVIRIEDYVPGKNAPRIYNLPGKFEEDGKKDDPKGPKP